MAEIMFATSILLYERDLQFWPKCSNEVEEVPRFSFKFYPNTRRIKKRCEYEILNQISPNPTHFNLKYRRCYSRPIGVYKYTPIDSTSAPRRVRVGRLNSSDSDRLTPLATFFPEQISTQFKS
jgi:hypothetical protein